MLPKQRPALDRGLNVTDIPKQSLTENEAGSAPSLPDPLSTLRWAFINGWKVEPQSDDRTPMFGEVAHSTASASARRSSARRKHQVMFKEWSQDRHE
jgi:hypothetical protein